MNPRTITKKMKFIIPNFVMVFGFRFQETIVAPVEMINGGLLLRLTASGLHFPGSQVS